MTERAKQLSRDDFLAWFYDAEKPPQQWRIGTEHEKFLFDCKTYRRPGYEGEHGIGALLGRIAERDDWTPSLENNRIIAIKNIDGSSITLEPGGQLELSGAVLETLHQTCAEVSGHLAMMQSVIDQDCLWMLGVGFDPLWRREDIPWMPKGRYQIMRRYMPEVGGKGIDMMLRTCTVQVNLDYADETDMARKFRTSLALQPVATAIFANSPFVEGKPSGLLSTRADVWSDTDPDRCGVPAIVFDDGFGYEAWIEYILDVPMYFLHRGDSYIDVAGRSFRDFMRGGLAELPGQFPTLDDWDDHVTTAFPEVRLKRFLEMRGADGGAWNMICALPALWTGILYDQDALAEAEALAKDLTATDVLNGRQSAAKDGLKGQLGGRSMLDLAREMSRIAEDGLRKRANFDDDGNDETKFLSPIKDIVTTSMTQADILLRNYHQKWDGQITELYEQYKY